MSRKAMAGVYEIITLEKAVVIAEDALNGNKQLHTFGEFRQSMKILIDHARKSLPAPKEEEQLEGQMDISDYGI